MNLNLIIFVAERHILYSFPVISKICFLQNLSFRPHANWFQVAVWKGTQWDMCWADWKKVSVEGWGKVLEPIHFSLVDCSLGICLGHLWKHPHWTWSEMSRNWVSPQSIHSLGTPPSSSLGDVTCYLGDIACTQCAHFPPWLMWASFLNTMEALSLQNFLYIFLPDNSSKLATNKFWDSQPQAPFYPERSCTFLSQLLT